MLAGHQSLVSVFLKITVVPDLMVMLAGEKPDAVMLIVTELGAGVGVGVPESLVVGDGVGVSDGVVAGGVWLTVFVSVELVVSVPLVVDDLLQAAAISTTPTAKIRNFDFIIYPCLIFER